jgi:uncharacterized protein (UPF0335 family)
MNREEMEKLKIERARETYVQTIKNLEKEKKEIQKLEKKAFDSFLKEISAGADYDNKVLQCVTSCLGEIFRGPAFGKRETFDGD